MGYREPDAWIANAAMIMKTVDGIGSMRQNNVVCQLASLFGVGFVAALQFLNVTVLDAATLQGNDNHTENVASFHEQLTPLVEDAIATGEMPGCVICVGDRLGQHYLFAFGQRQVEPSAEAMTVDTIFDLASLTKPVATATAVVKLLDDKQIRLTDPVSKYLPEFGTRGKEAITIEQLLIHQSGLIPDNAIRDYEDGPEEAWQRICELEPRYSIGDLFKYSDVNFIVLGKLVERLTGAPLDRYTADKFYAPLEMHDTGFNPPVLKHGRCAPTEKRDGNWIRGQVHDPRSYLLGGVAGHAGLFSTADDLTRYAQWMLREGVLYDSAGGEFRLLKPNTIAEMTKPRKVSSGFRGLGWDKQTGYSSNKGSKLSDAAFGHGGFTGTAMWIDPDQNLFVIFLSTRLHPDGKGSVNRLAGKVADLASEHFAQRREIEPVRDNSGQQVKLGVDVLEADQFAQLQGQRVGLITNQTGRTSDGRLTFKVLHAAPNVELVSLFSPEHGFTGSLDVSEISDQVDAETGLKIWSLYGKTRKPTPEMLESVDTVVFDIQDIGCRFYTYISTMGEAMQAAAEQGKRFVVLDRPNPIGGSVVSGPILDVGTESFVGFHPISVRHGMTVGELARMFAEELELEIDLQVIKCQGWQRTQLWMDTGLTWVNPSPNMRNVTQSMLYPGIGLLEMTNISVGRGTNTPFEVIGAPWMRGRDLAAALNAHELSGVRFVPIEFTPESSKFQNEVCSGVNVVITNWESFRPVRTGLAIARELRELHPNAWNTKYLNRLLCDEAVADKIIHGESVDAIETTYQAELHEFQQRRQAFLCYP